MRFLHTLDRQDFYNLDIALAKAAEAARQERMRREKEQMKTSTNQKSLYNG